jgi:hypothetical protein
VSDREYYNHLCPVPHAFFVCSPHKPAGIGLDKQKELEWEMGHASRILTNFSHMPHDQKTPETCREVVKLLRELRVQLMADLTQCYDTRIAQGLQEGEGFPNPANSGLRFQNMKEIRSYLTSPFVEESVIASVRTLIDSKVKAKFTFTNKWMGSYLMAKFGFGIHGACRQADKGKTANSFKVLVQEQLGNWKNSTNRALNFAEKKIKADSLLEADSLSAAKVPPVGDPLGRTVHEPDFVPPIKHPPIYKQPSTIIGDYPVVADTPLAGHPSATVASLRSPPPPHSEFVGQTIQPAPNVLQGLTTERETIQPPPKSPQGPITDNQTAVLLDLFTKKIIKLEQFLDAVGHHTKVLLDLYSKKILTAEQFLGAVGAPGIASGSHTESAHSGKTTPGANLATGGSAEEGENNMLPGDSAPAHGATASAPPHGATGETNGLTVGGAPANSTLGELASHPSTDGALVGTISPTESAFGDKTNAANGNGDTPDDEDNEGNNIDFADSDVEAAALNDRPPEGETEEAGQPKDDRAGDHGNKEGGEEAGHPKDDRTCNAGNKGVVRTQSSASQKGQSSFGVTLLVPQDPTQTSLVHLSDQTLADQASKDTDKANKALAKKQDDEVNRKKKEEERKEKKEEQQRAKKANELERKNRAEEEKRRRELAKKEQEAAKEAARLKKEKKKLEQRLLKESVASAKSAAAAAKVAKKSIKHKHSREIQLLVDVWAPHKDPLATPSPQMRTRSCLRRITRSKNPYSRAQRVLPTRKSLALLDFPPRQKGLQPADSEEGPVRKKTKTQVAIGKEAAAPPTPVPTTIPEPTQGLLSVKFERVSVLQPIGFKCDFKMDIVEIKPGEAAARSSLEVGMHVVAVNGQPVATTEQLRRLCMEQTRFDFHVSLPKVRVSRLPEPLSTLPFYRCEEHRTLLKEWESGTRNDVDYYMTPNRFLFQAVCQGCPRQRDHAGNVMVYKASEGPDGTIIPAIPKRHDSCPERGGLLGRFRGNSAKKDSICYWACRKCCQQFDAPRMTTEQMQQVSVICNDCYMDYGEERDLQVESNGKRSSSRRR